MSQSPSRSGEMPQPPPPQTPEMLPFPDSQFTPDALNRLSTLKRKASELSLSTPPKPGGRYVKWRILAVRAELEYVKSRRESLREALQNSSISQDDHDKYRARELNHLDDLEDEEQQLLGQGKFIEEDLKDSIAEAEGAYVHEIYTAWRRASSDGQRSIRKEKSLAMNRFSNIVAQHLGAEQVLNGEIQRFCSVLGIWMPKFYTNCAHIVPKSFETKSLAYIFGADDAALANVRNGIVMTGIFEEAFDNGWVTIVPDGSVETTPTQWKAILLNDAVKRYTIYTTEEKIWRFEDIHNRKLTWQNDNRPARRYLYLRYVMAIMHAEFEGWEGYRDKVPPGRTWASPNKPKGYLRRSVLRSLARKVNDEDVLPEELIEAGTFVDTDPPTGTDAADKLADLELGIGLRREWKKRTMEIDDDEEDMEDMEE